MSWACTRVENTASTIGLISLYGMLMGNPETLYAENVLSSSAKCCSPGLCPRFSSKLLRKQNEMIWLRQKHRNTFTCSSHWFYTNLRNTCSTMKSWVTGDLHGEELPHDLRTVPVPARDQPTPPLHYLVLQQCLYLLLKVKDSVLVCGFIVQSLWLLYMKSKHRFIAYII